MKIAIDATILRNQNTGTGFYIINLITGLMLHDKKNEYIIFGDKNIIQKFLKIDKKNFKIKNIKFKNRVFRVLWQWFFLSHFLKKQNAELLHSTNYITPLFKNNLKVIVTIHDMTFFIFPKKFTIVKRLFFKYMVPVFVKKADYVITVSENTKKDILKYLHISDKKVFVTYESYHIGYDDESGKKNKNEVLKKYNLKNDYLLFVGMIEPRKNIISILKAFIELDEELDKDLVIVGKKGWYYKEIEQFMNNIQNKILKNKIIFTGFVPEQELVYLYQNASIFLYPSLYEGFGIPPLEAMASGIPVITSNTSSLPEVVGDAALLIDPNNYLELKDAIKFLNENYEKRMTMSARGKERAKIFSLNNFVQNTLSVYEKVLTKS